LYNVLDRRLDGREFVAGAYSIADMSIFPWCRLHGRQGQKLEDFPNVERWFNDIAARPAVAKDMARLEDTAHRSQWTEEQWSIMFGAEQTRRR
jgi:GST-like protein